MFLTTNFPAIEESSQLLSGWNTSPTPLPLALPLPGSYVSEDRDEPSQRVVTFQSADSKETQKQTSGRQAWEIPADY